GAAPPAAAHRSATVVVPLPAGPPMTRVIDVAQAVSSNPPERNAHRLETTSEPDVLQDADHDLPERDGEQRVQQDPGREHVARVIQEHVVRPRHRDPLVPRACNTTSTKSRSHVKITMNRKIVHAVDLYGV